MKTFIKYFLALSLSLFSASYAYAQATLLPNAKQAFLDSAGNPLAGGTVTFYIPNTTTLKTTWQNTDKSILNTNPVILDSGGRAIIYGDGAYRQLVKDRNGNIVWDQLTASTAGGGGGGSVVVDGNPIGAVLIWSGFTPPTNYVFGYGQAVSRTSFASYLNVITQFSTLSCNVGSPVLTSISDTTQLPLGAKIESTCAQAGSYIISKTFNTVTMNANSMASTSAPARFFPYGNGDGVTTFNVPDYRGRAVVGRDNMGNSPASRLVPTYYGTDAASIGAGGGTQAVALSAAMMAPYNPSVTINDPGHAHAAPGGLPFVVQQVNGNAYLLLPGSPNSTSLRGATDSATTGITASIPGNGGSSTPFSVVQPSITANYIVKIASSN